MNLLSTLLFSKLNIKHHENKYQHQHCFSHKINTIFPKSRYFSKGLIREYLFKENFSYSVGGLLCQIIYQSQKKKKLYVLHIFTI